MEIVRKIAEPGTIYLNPDQLNWLGLNVGDCVVVKDDKGKWGNFISIFKASQPHHKKQVEENNNK
jgi:formylmethanofuran dehydrogenase subunit D